MTSYPKLCKRRTLRQQHFSHPQEYAFLKCILMTVLGHHFENLVESLVFPIGVALRVSLIVDLLEQVVKLVMLR